jgi:hypothetical protein
MELNTDGFCQRVSVKVLESNRQAKGGKLSRQADNIRREIGKGEHKEGAGVVTRDFQWSDKGVSRAAG